MLITLERKVPQRSDRTQNDNNDKSKSYLPSQKSDKVDKPAWAMGIPTLIDL